MTVLILSPFFFPEVISTGKYNTVLAKALAAAGNDVLVVSSYPIYPAWRPMRTNEGLPGITLKRGGLWVRYPRAAALRRAMLELWFALFCFKEYVRLHPKPSHVVAIFPPTCFMLPLKLAIARRSVVTGIVHDLQSVYVGTSKSLRSRLIDAIVSWTEKRSFATCHQLVFLSNSMAELAIRKYGIDPGRCTVCYPFRTATQDGATSSALADVLLPDHINVVYSGALGEKQCPEQLVRLMTELTKRHNRVRCHVFSAGPHFERLKASYSNDSDSTVAFRDLVPESLLAELYARSTVQLIPQAAGTSESSLPSKLPNLLAAGVPIFAICDDDSEISRFLEQTRAGLSTPHFSAEAATARFDALLKEIEIEPRAARISRLRPFVENAFSIERVVDVILRRSIDQTMSSPGSP